MTQPTSSDPSNLLAEALAVHRRGELAWAARLYQTALVAGPHHAEGWHLLGVLACQREEFVAACALIGRALLLDDRQAAYHANLAVALRPAAQAEAMIAACRRALCLAPSHRETLNTLGRAQQDLGYADQALVLYMRSLALGADYPDAINNLGSALAQLGRADLAQPYYRLALALRPGFAGALATLGLAGRRVEDGRRAVFLTPGDAEGHDDLGVVLQRRGRGDEALVEYRCALALDPARAAAWNNAGNLHKQMGRDEGAMTCYRLASTVRPDHPDALINRSDLLCRQGRLNAALACVRQALVLSPSDADGWNILANALGAQGRSSEALGVYRRAVGIAPHRADIHSNLLFLFNAVPDVDAGEIAKEHRAWAARHVGAPSAMAGRRPSGGGKLRIGYVSPDLRRHSVAYFLEPLLRNIDRVAFETVCYADVAQPDAVTRHLRSLSDVWHDTVGLDDGELAELVRDDGVDILVDLAGHTAGNRLRLFGARPAPVQVSWLGYPNTTGLSQINYRLVDAITDPPGDSDGYASETLLRLDGGFLCYGPPDEAPKPGRRPGGPTFGSFNNPAKLSAVTLAAWSELLRRVPEARLLLKGAAFADEAVRRNLAAAFSAQGIDGERLTMVGQLADPADHLSLYGDIDVALDPFPYNGTTTTCEALWMGVPVVTLRGDRHAARVGASLLTRIELQSLIAASVEDYCDIAAGLLADKARRGALRARLRERMASSPLCDGASFARRMEDAYHRMWAA